ncbi:MAG: hypothetical protein HY349_01035 [Nitrospirae bacterium]|nr:hypothetical protein [Nitrospirota bacterium]
MKRAFEIGMITAAVFFLSDSTGAGFELSAFSDVSFTECSRQECETVLGDRGGRNGNFVLGDLDFFGVNQFDQFDVLIELDIEEGRIVDLERLTLGYTVSDVLRIRAGRFHTPLGFWNPTYHHGIQIQPTIRRPQFLRFEDEKGILPLHTVGLYLSGRVRSGGLGIEYGAFTGNGPKITVEDAAAVLSPNNVSDNNPGKSVGGHVSVSPDGIPGLTAGAAGHFSRILSDPAVTALQLPSVDVNQTIWAGNLTYAREFLELTAEYYAIRDKDRSAAGGGTRVSQAYYALLSYMIGDRWVPYFMYESMSVKSAAGEDAYLIALAASDTTKTIAGVRYELSSKSSLRAEARKVRWGDFDWNEYGLQWAVGF